MPRRNKKRIERRCGLETVDPRQLLGPVDPDQFEDVDDDQPNSAVASTSDETTSTSDLSSRDPADIEQDLDSSYDGAAICFPVTNLSTISEGSEGLESDNLSSADEVTVRENTDSEPAGNAADVSANVSTTASTLDSSEVEEESAVPRILDPLDEFQQKLSIYEAEKHESFFSIITDLFNNKETTAQTVSDAISNLVNMCLANPFWSEILASHFRGVVTHKVYGNQCKKDLFHLLQKIYSEKELIAEKETRTFANVITMIGQIFLRYRSAGGVRFRFLSEPLCKLLHTLYGSNSTEDWKILVTQISLNGKSLRDFCTNDYEDLLYDMRIKMLATKDPTVQMWCLLALDVASYGMDLPDRLKTFYKNCLGNEIFDEMVPPEESELYFLVPPHLSAFYS